ncbi:MAG: glycosyltransferase family 2 protein [Ferruginibacter sp.]|nr:glycosyltransferase family 2 protein [Ferruginibacter sp.]
MLANEPFISVLITAYNRELFLAEAIESVLASSFKDFELIIVDDASSDSSAAIASGYIEKDERVKLYVNDKNLGQFANRNKAAAYARGVYIKYLDSDDILYRDSLQIMAENLKQFPQAAMGFCLTVGPCIRPLPYLIESQPAIKQHFFEGGLLFVGPSGLIIKRSVFESLKGFEEYGMPSDNHFSLKLASRFPVLAMKRDLFWWRLHEGQVFSHNKNNHQNILNNYRFVKDIAANYSPLSRAENDRILSVQKRLFLKNIFRLAFTGNLAEAIRLLKEFSK